MQNFLRQGGFAPLQSPKSCKRIIFDRKGTWILHFWFLQILVLLWKRRAAPLRPPKIIYFCKFRLKRVWNYAYLACKIQNFRRQGGAAPLATPARGPAPCTSVNTSRKRSVSSLCVAVEPTKLKIFLSLCGILCFYVPYLCGTPWLCMTSTLSCMKYEKRDYMLY